MDLLLRSDGGHLHFADPLVPDGAAVTAGGVVFAWPRPETGELPPHDNVDPLPFGSLSIVMETQRV